MTMEQIHNQNDLLGILTAAGSKPVVIAFLSYKCPHCKRLMPYLDSLCQQMPDVVFKKVEVNDSQDMVTLHGIEGVPHLMLYKNGILMYQISGANKEMLMNNLTEMRKQN